MAQIVSRLTQRCVKSMQKDVKICETPMNYLSDIAASLLKQKNPSARRPRFAEPADLACQPAHDPQCYFSEDGPPWPRMAASARVAFLLSRGNPCFARSVVK